MRVSVLALALGASALVFPTDSVLGQTQGVYLPPAPHGAGGEDSIETANGTRCRQSMNSNGAYLDMGAAASAASPTPEQDSPYRLYSTERDQRGMVYLRLTIPLGEKPERLDCTRLYEMELQRLREEIALLRMAAE